MNQILVWHNMAERALLNGLDDTQDTWSIVVRVMRKWKVFHKGTPNELLCICLLLIDAEVYYKICWSQFTHHQWCFFASNTDYLCFYLMVQGTRIQASIMKKEQHARFNKEVCEGRVYEFEYFEVIDNSLNWKPTNHRYKLIFGKQTNFEEVQAEIPTFSFNLLAIHDILSMPAEQNFPHLYG